MADNRRLALTRGDHIQFMGAKVTIFVGSKIVTILREDKPEIPWPNHWEVPGGGREGDESAWDCAAREAEEEIGVKLHPDDMIWARPYETGGYVHWFFVARLPEARSKEIALQDEGQALALVEVDDFLNNADAVPRFQQRLADWIAADLIAF